MVSGRGSAQSIEGFEREMGMFLEQNRQRCSGKLNVAPGPGAAHPSQHVGPPTPKREKALYVGAASKGGSFLPPLPNFDRAPREGPGLALRRVWNSFSRFRFTVCRLCRRGRGSRGGAPRFRGALPLLTCPGEGGGKMLLPLALAAVPALLSASKPSIVHIIADDYGWNE